MSRTVLFLGAGASVDFGYPLTNDILPAIWGDLRSEGWRRWAGIPEDESEAVEEHRVLVDFLSWVFPGLDTTAETVVGASIIDVISLLDRLSSDGSTPHPKIDESDLPQIRLVLNKAINGVLQGRSKPELARSLARWIVDRAEGGQRMTLASTNYDTVIEQQIYNLIAESGRVIPAVVDFGIPWRDPGPDRLHMRPHAAPLSVLKLHGSLNWLRCEACGHIYINPSGRVASQGLYRRRTQHNECHCGGRLRIVVVTPSVVRDIRDPNLLAIWNAAIEEFRRADEWVFAGYSLPSEDIAIRSLLLRAFHTRTNANLRVRVVQFEKPKRSLTRSAVYQRYRLFFPRDVLADDDYSRDGVEAFIESLGA